MSPTKDPKDSNELKRADKRKGRLIPIPIVEQGSNRVAGGLCSTMEAVSAEELQALARLKELRAEATEIKSRLRGQVDADEKVVLVQRLQTLRQEAAHWREKRQQATLEKHVLLGHVTL